MPPVPKGYARYVLAIMFGINLLNSMDRYVAAAVSPLIQKDFHLSDTLVGLIGTSFLLVYAVCALPFGYWADRGIRRNIVGIGVAIWSVATVLSGLVGNFAQLFLTRAAVGVGEASYYPAGTSLMADYFPKETRGRAMSYWGAGAAVGIAIGFAGGGYIGQHFGWRTAFFATAVPGLIFALLAFSIREPLRGAVEARGPQVKEAFDSSWRAFLDLMRIPTVRWTILAQTVLFFVLAANAYWLPINLNRRFQMDVSTAGLLSGVVLVLGGLIGTLLGGWLSDRRARKSQKGYLEVGIVGYLVAAVFITVALTAPLNVGPVPVFIPAFFITVVGIYLYSGPFTAVSQNCVPPSLRASVVTMLLFVSHVFGDSHATFDIGLLSDRLGSLQLALLLVSPAGLLVAAILAALGLRTVEGDVVRAEDSWAQRGTGVKKAIEPEPVPAG
jgi:MFS family permease